MTNAHGRRAGPVFGIGRKLAPPRFLLFVAVLAGTMVWTWWLDGALWASMLVRGFNLAASVFMLSLLPLGRDHTAEQMQRHSAENEAGRPLVLIVTALVMLAILGAIASNLDSAEGGDRWATGRLIFTLALAWLFTNVVFALHYAHAHYALCEENGTAKGGFEFPGTECPDYWDFLYFSFTAGMSFAASDVNVTRGSVRKVVLVQSMLAFVFSIGVIAFTINALSGASPSTGETSGPKNGTSIVATQHDRG